MRFLASFVYIFGKLFASQTAKMNAEEYVRLQKAEEQETLEKDQRVYWKDYYDRYEQRYKK